jgi:hypothetical protein
MSEGVSSRDGLDMRAGPSGPVPCEHLLELGGHAPGRRGECLVGRAGWTMRGRPSSSGHGAECWGARRASGARGRARGPRGSRRLHDPRGRRGERRRGVRNGRGACRQRSAGRSPGAAIPNPVLVEEPTSALRSRLTLDGWHVNVGMPATVPLSPTPALASVTGRVVRDATVATTHPAKRANARSDDRCARPRRAESVVRAALTVVVARRPRWATMCRVLDG